MITEETIIKKITPQKGYLLTNGEIITDCIFVNNNQSIEEWWEIIDENYVPDDNE